MADITASSSLPYSQDEAYHAKVRARRGKPWATCPHGVRWRTTADGAVEQPLGYIADGEEFAVHRCEAMKYPIYDSLDEYTKGLVTGIYHATKDATPGLKADMVEMLKDKRLDD